MPRGLSGLLYESISSCCVDLAAAAFLSARICAKSLAFAYVGCSSLSDEVDDLKLRGGFGDGLMSELSARFCCDCRSSDEHL